MRTAGFSWSRFRSFGSDPLLLVDAEISSPTVRSQVRLLVDTAASLTTLEPRVVEALGYSAADAFAPASVRSAIGREHGYRLRIAEAKLLGVEAKNIEVMVSPLGFDDMDGATSTFTSRMRSSSLASRSSIHQDSSRDAANRPAGMPRQIS
jgi:hypothetical protein